jgi:hypothetical protein
MDRFIAYKSEKIAELENRLIGENNPREIDNINKLILSWKSIDCPQEMYLIPNKTLIQRLHEINRIKTEEDQKINCYNQ